MPVFRAAFGPADCRLHEDSLAHDGFFRLRRLRLTHALFAGGQSAVLGRELIERRPAVGLLPYDPIRQTVVLIEQFRVGALADAESPWLLELVAGLIEAGESEAAVAGRETAEEAGLTVTALWPIGRYYSSPGGSNEQLTLFCGRVDAGAAGGIHGLAAEQEDIRVHTFALADVPALLAEGSVRNAHTLIALQWLLLQREAVQAVWG